MFSFRYIAFLSLIFIETNTLSLGFDNARDVQLGIWEFSDDIPWYPPFVISDKFKIRDIEITGSNTWYIWDRFHRLWHTIDAGEKWVPLAMPSTNMGNVEFLSNGTGFVPGRIGVWETHDGGETWHCHHFEDWHVPASICTSPTGRVIAASWSSVYIRGIAGDKWKRVVIPGNSNGDRSIVSRGMYDGGTYCSDEYFWICLETYSGEKKVLRITKDGKVAVLLRLIDCGQLIDISGDGGDIVVYAFNNQIAITINGGCAWGIMPLERITKGHLIELDVLPDGIMYALCREGRMTNLMKSADLGETWSKEKIWCDNDISEIEFLNESFGLAGSADGQLMSTSDGGATWDLIRKRVQPKVDKDDEAWGFFPWDKEHAKESEPAISSD